MGALRNLVAFFRTIRHNLTIAQKLVISYLFLGMATTITITFVFYKSSETALISRTLNQLTSIKLLKKKWLEQYLNTQKTDAVLFCSLESTRTIFKQINNEYHLYGTNSPIYEKFTSHIDQSLVQYKLNHNFINIWLVNNQLEVIYTGQKNQYRGQDLQKYQGINPIFLKVCQKGLQQPYIADVEYLATNDQRSFLILVCPVTDANNRTQGFLLAKINMMHINTILTQRTGMGNTGESYVVAQNLMMRSVSRFIDEKEKGIIYVNTIGTKKAFSGQMGKEIIKDYRNIDVLSSFASIQIDGLYWAILSEIDLEEALQPIYELRKKIFPLVFTVCIIILFITLYLAQEITQPIQTLSKLIGNLSKGILPEKVIKPSNNDEIGEMIASINQLVDGLKKTSLFAADIGKGNFTAHFDPLSEKDMLGLSLLEMRARLIELSNIIQQQNRQKTINLIEGQENERRRISRELHDGVGQMLTALNFKIQELPDSEITTQLKTLIDETTQEVRRVSVNLMPSVIYDFGLEAALKILIKNTNLDINFIYQNLAESAELNMDVRICVYRIVQESLTNILKYAQNKKVEITVFHTKNALNFKIQDHGAGFDIDKYRSLMVHNSSNGIRNMKERAKLVGGSFKITSQISKGTLIEVRIPL